MVGEATEALEPYLAYFSRPATDVMKDFYTYAHLLQRWQRIQNLVSRETLPELWVRHFADSVQLLPHIRSEDRRFLDVGSGAGFPALPLAIALKGHQRSFALVEPNSRKASFLRAVARELILNVTVLAERLEDLAPGKVDPPDLITSRALAPLPRLLELVSTVWSPQTRALFHKGREHVEELAKSAALWHYDSVLIPSRTDGQGVIIEIRNLVRR